MSMMCSCNFDNKMRAVHLAQEPYACSVAVCSAVCVAACVAVCASEFMISLWRKKLYACRALCNTYRCRHTYSLTTYMFTYHIVRATGIVRVHARERDNNGERTGERERDRERGCVCVCLCVCVGGCMCVCV